LLHKFYACLHFYASVFYVVILKNCSFFSKINCVCPAVHTSTPTRVSQEELPTKIIAVLATANGVSMEKFSPIGSTLRAINWWRAELWGMIGREFRVRTGVIMLRHVSNRTI
jgi:hypothetical protein